METMRILFISKDVIGGDLARVLKQEGHDVKLYIDNKDGRKCLDGIVTKTTNWRKELPWVGKNGLIIFDDTGYGKIQDKLREEGYSVFGGSELGEKLELDREYGQLVFSQYGIKTVPLKDFFDIHEAIEYIKKNPAKWVLKHNDHSNKNLTYTGILPDGSDVIDVLKSYEFNPALQEKTITLQEKIEGVEISVGRFFNGHDWVGPIEVSMEHTKFFPGDLGPITSEMGTLSWYDADEKNRLYIETLAKLKPYLSMVNYRGDVAINCIVNERGAFPLEATMRLGSPIIHLQVEIHTSPWGEFLLAIARGNKYDLRWKEGYGIATMIAVPPFPYTYKLEKYSLAGTNIFFDPKFGQKEFEHIHFEEVALRPGTKKQYYIADSRGYTMYVTAVGETVEQARARMYKIIKGIHIPQSFYRNDIGLKYIREDKEKLRKLGYVNALPSFDIEESVQLKVVSRGK